MFISKFINSATQIFSEVIHRYRSSLAGVLKILTVAIFSLFYTNAYAAQQSEQSVLDIDKIILEHRLLTAQLKMSSDLSSVDFLLSKLNKCPDLLSPSQKIRLSILQGNRLILIGEFTQAQLLFEKLAHQTLPLESLARLLYFRAIIAQHDFDYETAFIYLNRLDQLDHSVLPLISQFDILTLATSLYSKANAMDEALGYAHKAMALANKSKQDILVCQAWTGLNAIYQKQNNFDKLKIAVTQAINVCTTADETLSLANAYVSLAAWYQYSEMPIQQQQWLQLAIELFMTQDSAISVAKTQLLLARSLLQSEQLNGADAALNLALTIIEDSNNPHDLMDAYEVKAMWLEKMGLLDDAMFYFKQYLNARKNSNDIKKITNIAYLQTHFDSKVNRQSMEISHAERDILALKKQNQYLQNWVMLLLALLGLSLTIFTFTFYRRKRDISLFEDESKDELTGLYKQEYGFSLMKKAIVDAKDNHQSLSVIMCDVDAMTAINDSYSHDVGDILLRTVAQRINAMLGDRHLAIRISGDAFMLAINGFSKLEMNPLLGDIHSCFDDVVVNGKVVRVSCSSGWGYIKIGEHSNVEDVLDSLVEQSKHAMLCAKQHNRGKWLHFSDCSELSLNRFDDMSIMSVKNTSIDYL
ncbi:MAG: GGDEF domain-containing protein [Psychrobium sp.]|nr:GGDEF domain-containing protein [Psychrobium sp.]